MSGKSTPANQAGKKGAQGATKTAANANTNAAPAAQTPAAPAATKADGEKAEGEKAPVVNTGVQAPAKPKLEFKIGKKQLPTGKRGGGTRSSKYTSGALLKFAEAPYGNVEKSKGQLLHVLNGAAMIVYAHISGFYADHLNVISDNATEEGTTGFASYNEALAARQIMYATREVDGIIGYAQNNKLPEGAKTSKPTVAYHCFLTATSAEEIQAAVNNLEAFKAIPGADLFNVDKNLVFLTDEEGNIVAEPLVVPVVAQAAKIAPDGTITNTENADETATDETAADETAKANSEEITDEVPA